MQRGAVEGVPGAAASGRRRELGERGRLEVQRTGVGLDGAGVGDRARRIDSVEVPLPAVLRMVPAFTTAIWSSSSSMPESDSIR